MDNSSLKNVTKVDICLVFPRSMYLANQTFLY